MKTIYAAGRVSAPVITIGTGNIDGENTTYYFWKIARNRVGFSDPSEVLSLEVPSGTNSLEIATSNFTVQNYEGWTSFYIAVSNTNNFFDSRVIYRHNVYLTDQVTLAPNTTVSITEQYILTGTPEYNTPTNFPENPIRGFRVKDNTSNNIFEYDPTSTDTIDNITVLAASPSGRWIRVKSNSFTEVFSTSNREVINVTELDAAPISSIAGTPIEIKYWIINDNGTNVSNRHLRLNEYLSDMSLTPNFNVKVYGYLDIENFTLDTSGISYVGNTLNYSTTDIVLPKALPDNNAFVVGVIPALNLAASITPGSTIAIYPLLSEYQVVDTVDDWDSAVEDLSELSSLTSAEYKNLQIRYVVSVDAFYRFETNSNATANGNTIIIPDTNPTNGRWIRIESNIPDGSITYDKLGSSVTNLFSSTVITKTINIALSGIYNLDLDSVDNAGIDYFILNCPDDSSPTIINPTYTASNNTSKTTVIEIRQGTSVVSIHTDFNYPGGNIPLLSGNNKTDLIVIEFNKDGNGTLKKRAVLANIDIG